jgi:AcrR family transcriptional regulator
MSAPARRPGREWATEALIAAARRLFAERGPAAVSLREVAAEAGVNHGLIHHYIGSRDDLLHAVFAGATETARSEVADAADPVDALRSLRTLGSGSEEFTRLLAWALLEGHDPTEFHGRSAALEAVVATGGADSRRLRTVVAMAMVQSLGWKLFGAYACMAAGLGADEVDGVRRELDDLMDRLVADAAREAA